MKRIFSAIVAVCIIFSGCSKTLGTQVNEFTASDAIKGQVGELYYVVPSNAVVGEYSSDGAMFYETPIENSSEKYSLSVMYLSMSYIKTNYDSVEEYIDELKSNSIAEQDQTTTGMDIIEFKEISEILGVTPLYGETSSYTFDGKTSKGITFTIDSGSYYINYTVDTAFYDEAIWDNFYSQLKLV